MLYLLGEILQKYYGPFRLLTSHLFLAGFGLLVCGILSWWLLPRFARLLPSDRGKEFAVQSEIALGKPTGAGMLFICMYLIVQFLVVGKILRVMASARVHLQVFWIGKGN